MFQNQISAPVQVLIKIAVVMFTMEVAIMLVLGDEDGGAFSLEHAVIDSTMLTVLAAPIIHYWIIRPYIRQRDEAAILLRQSQKMEAIGRLTGGVAHDFNNMLTVVTGNLELLHERLKDEELRVLAQKSLNSAFRGADLTQQLLAYSRKQALSPMAVNIGRHVAGMSDMMRRTLGETIEIKVTTGDDLWGCKIDPGQLENAVLNLAINARDAMPNGGRLIIETRNIQLENNRAALQDKMRPGDYVMVSVSDNGTGIPQDSIERAFEPFYTTKEVGEGSGLGLSMVYGFTKQSNGYVTMDSAEGVGTTVSLFFPRTTEASETAQADAA